MSCALWGGISLGFGTLLYALFSPASMGCSTNVVILTHGTVTARGCAAYSAIAHAGVGLIVLGAVLLLGSFALVLRTRRQGGTDRVASAVREPVVASGEGAAPLGTPPAAAGPAAAPAPVPTPAGTVGGGPARVASGVAVSEVVEPDAVPPVPAPEPVPPGAVEPPPGRELGRTRPIAPGEEPDAGHDQAARDDEAALRESPVRLPPGWYGNPDTPGGPVLWWDGTKLTERPG
jgi:hypothetical protein